jgi:acetyl esterase
MFSLTGGSSFVRKRFQTLLRSRLLLVGALVLGVPLAGAADSGVISNPMFAYTRREQPLPYTQAKLDAGSRAVLDKLASRASVPPWTMPPRQLRDNFDSFFGSLNLGPLDVANRENRTISGPHGPISLRIFRPRDPQSSPLPVLVYYHGGGMMMNSTDTYDSMLQLVSSESGAAVVSVDFRLAPENRFPAGVDDAYAGLLWVHAHAAAIGLDPARIAIGGDSGGGYLTAVISQIARDRGGPALTYQIMIYPAVGTRGHSRSLDLYSEGYFFSREELAWVYAEYVGDAELFSDPRVQPILATDFSRLPPAFIVTAEFDILRDDAEEYAGLLRAAGVPAEVHRYEGTIHAFLNMSRAIPAGRAAISEVAMKLRSALFPGITTPTHNPHTASGQWNSTP